jgi:hypothetical protein
MPRRCDGRFSVPPRRTAAAMFSAVMLLACGGAGSFSMARAADALRGDLTVTKPRRPIVPSPLLPGAPIPYSGSPLLTPLDLSIVDGRTRFLTSGPAQDRCPGDSVVFVPGVVNPFRPTAPGDGAYMCQGDAIAEGFSAR